MAFAATVLETSSEGSWYNSALLPPRTTCNPSVHVDDAPIPTADWCSNMFTSFNARQNGREEAVATSREPTEPSPARPTRPKRRQVTRACDWCRSHRVKCDNSVPCNNCLSRGHRCSLQGSGEFRTLTHAYREIERLRQKIADLEFDKANNTAAITPSRPQVASRQEVGVYAGAAHSQHKTWYGPFSLFYFIHRMNTHLTLSLRQPHQDKDVHFNSVAKSFDSPDCRRLKEMPKSSSHRDDVQSGHQLSPIQEEYFLDLFWPSYHCSLLVLNEAQFKAHFKSLCTPGAPREPSAVVDIVLALSMQYGLAVMPHSSLEEILQPEVDANDPTIAGHWYYRRCQSLLNNHLEAPTIETVQSQILSVIYLCCASFQNMAHGMLAIAVRTAHMLRLHVEPPDDLPNAEKERRKRIWWSLYVVESKTSMKLSRPFLTDLSTVSCTLPADDIHAASLAGSDFASLNETVTWLTYNLQNTKLVLTARDIYQETIAQFSEQVSDKVANSIYDDPVALEKCSQAFDARIIRLTTWAHEVPEPLVTPRRDGTPFSADSSPLVMERFAPLWLQRQRVLLELLYHNLSMNLYRQFIVFPTTNVSCLSGTTSPSHATSAVNHGMTLVRIMHQVLTEANIITGWHEAFQWQWNAAITLVGYLLAYPTSSRTVAVRESIQQSLAVFKIFGRSFAAASSAANIIRGLVAKSEYIVEGLSRVDITRSGAHVAEEEPMHTGNSQPWGTTGLNRDMGEDGSSCTANSIPEEISFEDLLFMGSSSNNSMLDFGFPTFIPL